MNKREALNVAVNLRLAPGLDAVDHQRAWALWEYIEKTPPPPWECETCGGKGFVDYQDFQCPSCRGRGDLLPEPVEPEGD